MGSVATMRKVGKGRTASPVQEHTCRLPLSHSRVPSCNGPLVSPQEARPASAGDPVETLSSESLQSGGGGGGAALCLCPTGQMSQYRLSTCLSAKH